LMAGDIGLAGVGGLGPFDPLPLPFGKVIGEGVKGAKAGVRAVRGAVRGADEAAEGGVAAARALDTEDVPIEFFDDMQGNPGVMAGEVTNQAKVDKLAASIAEDGITEPLILEFHPGTGLVWLGEGNHRLAAARQLGLDSVPVRGVRYEPTPSEVRLSGDGKRLSPYTLEHLNNDDWFGEAWVSESGERLQATFTPSQVGVPTAGGVARETGEATARTVVGETAPTLDAFTEMAGRGKLHPATGRDLPGEATATNPFEFGVINGYSEDDIAHFYLALRAPWNKARTARNVGAVRDDMRELAYEQFLEDRAEYLAKQSGAPLGSVHRQLSDEIGKADVVRGESGEMMLEVDDVEAFDAALKAWEEANPVTPFTEAMERLDPPAGGVARETGEAVGRHDTPFVAAARTNPKLNRLETSLQEVEERLNDALSPEMDGLRWSYISDNELIDEVADELANDPEYQRTLQQVLSDVFGGTEKDPIVLYRGRIPGSDSGREYVAASAHPRWAAAFGQGGFDLRGIAGLPDGELVELTVPRGNIAFHGSAEEAELIVSLDENVIERVIESLPRIPGR